MSATDHGQCLTQITHLRVFNCYLVREQDGLTLVDTGPARAAARILQQIDRIGLPLRPIVLTHAHSDHVAGLDQIAGAIGDGVEIIVGRREAALLAGDLAPRAGQPATTLRSRSYGTPSTKPTRLVDDEQQVGSLKVIDTPGHTPGHISLLDTRDSTLIAGDAVTAQGRVAVSGDLVLTWPFPALSTWDKPTALASAKRLLGEQPARLATGHGPVLDHPVPTLLRAIARIATSDPLDLSSATTPAGVAGTTFKSSPSQE